MRITILLFVFLVGCSQVTPIQHTTYPQQVYGTVTTEMVLPVSINNYHPTIVSSKNKMIDFTNESEFVISSSEVGTTDKFRMVQAIPQKCGKQYKVVYIKYYTGQEATSAMLGYNLPWLKVIVRYPIEKEFNPSSPGIIAIENLTKDVEDSNYFDSHSQEFPFKFEVVWNTVHDILLKQGDNIWESDIEKGVIITDETRHYPYGFLHYHQYYIVVTKIDSNLTRVSFKLFNYFSLVSMDDPASLYTVTLAPENRYFVYANASKFMVKIGNRLEKVKN